MLTPPVIPFFTGLCKVDLIAVDYVFFSGGRRYPFRSIGVEVAVKHPAAVKAPHLLHVGEPEVPAFGLRIAHIRSRLPRSRQCHRRYGLLEVEGVGPGVIFHGNCRIDVP